MTMFVGTPAESDRDALRIGTSGDYAPFSVRGAESGDPPTGFGPDVARAYASDRDLALEFVPFTWPELLGDLEVERFDVAMGGVTVRPERSLAGVFTVPVAVTGAVALVPEDSNVVAVTELDRPGRRIAVNAGGHLERVTRGHFPQAEVLAIPGNARVLSAIHEHHVDAVVTDTGEAPHWLARAPGLRAVGPFTRDRKAFLVRADRTDLAADLDAWLLAAEQNGTLARLREKAFGANRAPAPTATPLSSLLAAIDERLALMPHVAEAKRAGGSAVEVPEREALVVDSAVEAVRRALRQTSAPRLGPDREAAVRALFVAQIEAAKQIQKETLANPPAPRSARVPDLDAELRPALIRIGDRIARLVVALPNGLDPIDVGEATALDLDSHDLDATHLDAIAAAIAAISRSTAATAIRRIELDGRPELNKRPTGSGDAARP